jgi:hypothetical protein
LMELDQTLIDDGDVLTAGGALAWPIAACV